MNDENTMGKNLSVYASKVSFFTMKIYRIKTQIFCISSCSELMDIDGFRSYQIPSGAYDIQWINSYFQKNGNIQFLNPANVDSFRSTTLNFGYFNSSDKERGYFEYFIKNDQ